VRLFLVGGGYVGLTTAVGLAAAGHVVLVHDIDHDRVRALSAGRSPIFEPGLEESLRAQLATGRLSVTAEPSPPRDTDAAIVCVPTPRGADGLLDTTIVEGVVTRLQACLPASAVIGVRSTLPLHGPDRLQTIATARASGPTIVVNPEFMREGHALADFNAPSRIVVGFLGPGDRPAAESFARLYDWLDAPVVIADAKSVVLVKLASNVFLGMKIAFADELARLSDSIGADIDLVADGLGLDPRIGRSFLTSGPGFGGSCLPEQAEAIAVEVASRGLAAPLLASIAVSNRTHGDEIVTNVGAQLEDGLAGARIALLGLAFKANTDDVRESPALEMARTLRSRGAVVVGFDPVASLTARRADPDLEVVDTAEMAAAGAMAVVIVTEWPEFASLDWSRIRAVMRGDLVYDTRRIADGDAVRAASLRYVSLGRAGVVPRAAEPA
jgi:UDPglucose 6-dehydrogenase